MTDGMRRNAVTTRRTLLGLGLAWALALVLPPRAEARCARIPPRAEVARSRYVFEGTVESVGPTRLTLVVTAVWKGTPPARVTVSRSGRDRGLRDADVGRAFLVFAAGESDTALTFSRCGSTGPLETASALLEELRAMDLTRTAR